MAQSITAGVALSDVVECLELGASSLVAFVGGGGKTTTMFAVGAALDRVVMTTTTKMGATRVGGFETMVGADVEDLTAKVASSARVLAWRTVQGTKAVGYKPEFCDQLSQRVDHVLVEADGARRRPLTAPGPLEPVIPSMATHVVAMIGADAIGRCIGDQCHRPLRVAALAGCRPYDRLTPERAARVLLSDRGLRKGVPPNARFMVGISKVLKPLDDQVVELIERLGTTTVLPILVAADVQENRP